jgi:hypothetical protein
MKNLKHQGRQDTEFRQDICVVLRQGDPMRGLAQEDDRDDDGNSSRTPTIADIEDRRQLAVLLASVRYRRSASERPRWPAARLARPGPQRDITFHRQTSLTLGYIRHVGLGDALTCFHRNAAFWRLEPGQARLYCGRIHAVCDRSDNACNGPLDLRERLAIGIRLHPPLAARPELTQPASCHV